MSIALLRRLDGSAAALGAAFSPASVAGFTAWYAYDRGNRWQDAAGTVPATAVNDPVYGIDPYLGSGDRLVVTDNAQRFLIAANGLVGDATKTGYQRNIDLSGAYTLLFGFQLRATAVAKHYAGVLNTANNHAYSLRAHEIGSSGQGVTVYENQDAAVTDLAGTAGSYTVVGTSGIGGNAIGYDANGGTTSIDGSSGGTTQNAASVLYWGAGALASAPADSSMPICDVMVFSGQLSGPTFIQLRAFLTALRA